MLSHPPKPRLALTVGVIGHRPNRLRPESRAQVTVRIAEALELMQKAVLAAHERHARFFAPEPPRLTLMSELAEGADRMVAQAALEQGFTLSAVLPFQVEEYEADFKDASSRAQYRTLLGRSANTLVLCGARAQQSGAYAAAGRTVLDTADVVLAVWDGGASAAHGGTTELLERAASAGLPIVCIDASAQIPTRILWSHLAAVPLPGVSLSDVPSASIGQTAQVIDQLLRPPAAATRKLQLFLSGTWRARNRHPAALFAALGWGVRREPHEPAFTAVAAAFGWADALAERYAQIFRGAYTLNFTAAALAVSMSQASLVADQVFHIRKLPFVIVEIVLVLIVIGNTAVGRRRHWHGRWLETRGIAEQLRAGLLLWLLGQQSNAFAGEPTWSGWYVCAHLRALGMRAAVLDEATLTHAKESILRLIDAQRRYHAETTARLDKIERRLARTGEVLFGLTLAVALAYLGTVLASSSARQWWDVTVTALTAGLPAFGAASYAVRLTGDFAGGAQRSRRTGKGLAAVGDALRQAPPALAALRSLARAAAEVMLGDVVRWRIASEPRQLAIPG